MIRLLGGCMLVLMLLSAVAGQSPPVPPKIICTVGKLPILRLVKPTYPREARANRIAGRVVLELEINSQGEPQRIKVKSGNPVFINATVDAVKQWRWQPYILNGKAISVQSEITVKFELPRKKMKRRTT